MHDGFDQEERKYLVNVSIEMEAYGYSEDEAAEKVQRILAGIGAWHGTLTVDEASTGEE